MKPLTFPCPKCEKRLGVGLDLAGKSVRCPHCREVVVAPTAATAPAPDLLSQAAPRESAESIFADPEESDDGLFAAPPRPVLTITPPEPQRVPATRLPNPIITPPPRSDRVAEAPDPPGEANPFELPTTGAPTPVKRKLPEKQPINWKPIAFYALIGYSVLMTVLAVWGWLRG
jgi:hypothetical protein